MFLDLELHLSVCCIPRSSSSSVIFFLVFSFLIYNPFFLLLFLFEVSLSAIGFCFSLIVWPLFHFLCFFFVLRWCNLLIHEFIHCCSHYCCISRCSTQSVSCFFLPFLV